MKKESFINISLSEKSRTLSKHNTCMVSFFHSNNERMITMQLAFLPEIDRDATKKNVESELEKYKIMLLMDPEDLEPKITSSFRLVPSSSTNQFYSTTEDTAVERIHQEQKRRTH